MMGWAVALILYVLPILAILRNWDDELENVRDWMREPGNPWFPHLAPSVVVVMASVWPLTTAMDAILPKEDGE